jgi:hypothetical protein
VLVNEEPATSYLPEYRSQTFADYSINISRKRLTFVADHNGRAVYDTTCLHALERWDRAFESHSRHGCLFVFIVSVLGSGLDTG